MENIIAFDNITEDQKKLFDEVKNQAIKLDKIYHSKQKKAFSKLFD